MTVQVAAATAVDPTRLLLDELAGSADTSIAAHTIVDATPEDTFRAAKSLDLLQVRTPLLTASFWVRALPARLLGRDGPELPGPLTLERDLGIPGWMKLGERPGREIDFGAVGVFWEPVIRWNLDVTASQFATFDEPGWGKIACSYSVADYGRRSLLTYECRTTITDDDSRAKFDRYWWLVRPFVQHVMRATVRTIAADAERAAR
jgi:hypothetical protein